MNNPKLVDVPIRHRDDFVDEIGLPVGFQVCALLVT
jgi:hypothetical protein